jgi:Phage major capsid protein E
VADLFTRTMLAAYDEQKEQATEGYFLQGLFTKVEESDTEKVVVDVMRAGRSVAVDVIRRGDQSHVNTLGEFTSKEYEAPLYAEEGPITAGQLNRRFPGDSLDTPVSKGAKMIRAANRIQLENTHKIARAMELQAAQALLTGTVTLKNTESLDYHKKAAHAVTPGTKWDAGTPGNPISDIKALAQIVFRNGRIKPDTLIFGEAAWDVFINNTHVKAYFENRRIDLGIIRPGDVMAGATFQGSFAIGDYRFNAYTYPEFYLTDATTPVATPYVTTDSVIMMARGAVLTRAFAAVEVLPQYASMYDEMGMPTLPALVPGQFVPYAYVKPPRAVMAGVQSAPLVIPTAIDTIATLDNVDT